MTKSQWNKFVCIVFLLSFLVLLVNLLLARYYRG